MIKTEVEQTQTVFVLPNGLEMQIEDVPGFVELTEKQRYFIECYIENFPSLSIAMVRSGTKKGEFNEWNYNFDVFHDVLSTIKDLHVEGLLIKEYTDSKENSKIRGRVLMALNAPGYEKKTSVTNNHLHVGDTDLFTAISTSRAQGELPR